MTFVVYALRRKGDTEARYIGQTKDLSTRVSHHLHVARRMPYPTTFAMWFRANRDEVEAVELAAYTTRDEAIAAEKNAILMFSAFGHRLFNRQGVSPEKKLPQRDETCGPAPAWLRAA